MRYPGQFAWFRGPKDAARWYERNKKKGAAPADLLLNNRIFDVEGEGMTVHVHGDEQWQFIFGRDDGKAGGSGSGAGKGGKDGDAGFDIHISPEDLDKILFEGLELPKMIRKKSTETEMVGLKLAGLDKTGSRSDWARKETVREYFKRAAGAIAADPRLAPLPGSGLLVPADKLPLARRDFRFWQYDSVRQPITKCTVYILVDRSGSMTEEALKLIFLYDYLLVRFLTRHYKFIRIVFLGHTSDEPKQYADWEEMRKDRLSGGTKFSPALKWVLDHARSNGYLASDNCYLFQGSDGDNWQDDESSSLGYYRQMIDSGFNFIFYTNAETPYGSGSWPDSVAGLPEPYRSQIHVGRLTDQASVLREFQNALRKNAART
jgi:uncharacterized sporulation protein YeaH/YhbH (DUF444 family)